MSDGRLMMEPRRNPDKTFIQKLFESGLKTITLSFTCRDCGTTWDEDYGPLSIIKFWISGTRCPNCHHKNYDYEYLGTLLSIAIGITVASIGINFW